MSVAGQLPPAGVLKYRDFTLKIQMQTPYCTGARPKSASFQEKSLEINRGDGYFIF
jgi:hypothetical protein